MKVFETSSILGSIAVHMDGLGQILSAYWDLKKRDSDISVSSGKPRYKIVITRESRNYPPAFIIALKF